MQDALENIYREYHLDSGAAAELTTDMIDFKNTSFAIAYITRYKDMVRILLNYCEKQDTIILTLPIKNIPQSDRK